MPMSAKKYIDGIAEESTLFVVEVVVASHVVEVNKRGCGCFEVIPSKPTI
jgi:hypothetical protein